MGKAGKTRTKTRKSWVSMQCKMVMGDWRMRPRKMEWMITIIIWMGMKMMMGVAAATKAKAIGNKPTTMAIHARHTSTPSITSIHTLIHLSHHHHLELHPAAPLHDHIKANHPGTEDDLDGARSYSGAINGDVQSGGGGGDEGEDDGNECEDEDTVHCCQRGRYKIPARPRN